MGMPNDSSSVESMAGSSDGPSTPQFHDRLSSVPSLLASPFASLCLASYETRSRRVKPSWTVMRFTDAVGRRPDRPNMSDEPQNLVANSPMPTGWLRQKSRMVSRYLPFHSRHTGGNRP